MKTISQKIKDARYHSSISLLIIFVLTIAFFATIDLRVLKSIILKFNIPTIILMLVLVFCNYVIRAYRFFLSARRLGVSIPFIQNLLFYIAGFVMSLTPGKLGELLRLWLIRQHYNYGIEQTLPLQISDRAMDACGCLMLCLIGFSAFSGYESFLVIVTIFLVVAILILMRPVIIYWSLDLAYRFIGRKGRLFAKLRIFMRSLSNLFTPKFFLIALLLSCAGWLAECIAFYLCVQSVDDTVLIGQATFIFTFSNLAGALTFLPGGLGGTEVLMIGLLKNIGISFENAVIVTAIIRIITLWFGTLLGLVVFLWIKGSNVELSKIDLIFLKKE